MRIFTYLFLFIAVFTTQNVNAQNNRYLNEVFDEVEVSGLVPVASNYTILNWIATQGVANTLRQPLVCQFYTPKGDTERNRPLVIYLHTGNFFPFPANGSCGGTMRDSSNVEIATRLAKMGYVVAVVNYRQGWNPFHPQELIRRYFLINAAYRGVQDVSTYVRYFRRSAAELNNPHGIDPEKITVWGQGTGGYLSLAAAYLNNYSEIFQTADPTKFLLPLGDGSFIPMVFEKYNGNIEATGSDVAGGTAVVDATYNAISQLKVGDTLCVPNHVGFSSDFALAVNLGGALGDSSWLNQGEVPLISYHNPTDFFAPCETDVLNVPTPNGPQPVVEVSGSCDLAARIERLGNNDVFKKIIPSQDPYGQVNTTGFPGYYAFKNTHNEDTSSPWEWAASETTAGGATGCNVDAAAAKTYIDTIIGYFAPRACVALGLPCQYIVSVKDITEKDVNLSAYPNPAAGTMFFKTSDDAPMRSLEVVDFTGRNLFTARNINASQYELNGQNLLPGMYFVKISFDSGNILKKVLFY